MGIRSELEALSAGLYQRSKLCFKSISMAQDKISGESLMFPGVVQMLKSNPELSVNLKLCRSGVSLACLAVIS